MSIEYYDTNAKEYFELTKSIDTSHEINRFLRYVRKSGYILDAGCGSGRDSLYMINLGYQVKAIDASSELAKLASRYIGQKIDVMKIEDIPYFNTFDGIWANASLVHSNEEEILNALGRFSNALKKFGILYISIKHGQGVYEKHGRTFYLYDEASWLTLVNKQRDIIMLDIWRTEDKLKRENQWLNVLMVKDHNG